MKSRLFYIAILLIAIMLVVFSLSSVERSDAIMAQVESQKTAISFQRPVQIKTLHVSPGQRVEKGQLLVEVERPDLVLDRERLENDRLQEEASKKKVLSEYRSRIALLNIEVDGKTERLGSEIEQLRAEMRYDESVYSSVLSLAGADSTRVPENEERKIRIASLENEMKRLQQYRLSELNRLKTIMEEDINGINLKLEILKKEMQTLEQEESTLKRLAPFDGIISNVNSQLLELVPPYQTILSLFEEHPSTIKAHLNLESGQQVAVGQKVKVESAARQYVVEGEIIEIGSRIVGYRDPASPPSVPDLFGREIFVRLPTDNAFLYGEQVYVFIIQP